MQKLWLDNQKWDQNFSDPNAKAWNAFKENLTSLESGLSPKIKCRYKN